jgi:hypothetical protein
MASRRPTLSISADEITYTSAASARTWTTVPRTIVLDRSAGNDLRLVTAIRRGGKYAGLTVHGSGTTLPLSSFDVSQVRRTCMAKGWHFTA